MHDLRIMFWALFAVFVAAAALAAIPVIGSILALILAILAFLAFLIGGAVITHQDAGPPSGDGFNGVFNAYDAAGNPGDPVDVVYGRWSYDSLHSGWNEIHPLLFMTKLGTSTQGGIAGGDWGIPDLPGAKSRLDATLAANNTPASANTQSQPQNDWTLHPVLDGCGSATTYPTPPPPK